MNRGAIKLSVSLMIFIMSAIFFFDCCYDDAVDDDDCDAERAAFRSAVAAHGREVCDVKGPYDVAGGVAYYGNCSHPRHGQCCCHRRLDCRWTS